MSAQALVFYMRESAPKGDPLESPDLLVCPLPLVPKDLLVCWCAGVLSDEADHDHEPGITFK